MALKHKEFTVKNLIATLLITAFSFTSLADDYLAQTKFNAGKSDPAKVALQLIQSELSKQKSKLIDAIEFTLIVDRANLVTLENADLVLLDTTTDGLNVNQLYIVPLRIAWKSSTTTAGFLIVRANFADEGDGIVTLENVVQVPDFKP